MTNNKTYVCECGNTFYETSRYAAHARYCRIHAEVNNRDFDAEREARRIALFERGQEARAIQREKVLTKKKQELENWKHEQHTCEKCGKIMTEKFGSGRFCSKSCANGRPKSQAERNKIRQTLLETIGRTQNLNLNITKPENTSVGRYKFSSGYFHSVYCGSSYELAFLAACEIDKVVVERCKLTFKYLNPNDNRIHIYIPDFFLPVSNTIVEIKSEECIYYNSVEVSAKNQCVIDNGYNLLYIADKDIVKYFNKVKQHYKITDIRCLYDDRSVIPSKKHVPRTAGRYWVYNNELEKQTLVKKEDVERYLSEGWELGRPANSSFKNCTKQSS